MPVLRAEVVICMVKLTCNYNNIVLNQFDWFYCLYLLIAIIQNLQTCDNIVHYMMTYEPTYITIVTIVTTYITIVTTYITIVTIVTTYITIVTIVTTYITIVTIVN